MPGWQTQDATRDFKLYCGIKAQFSSQNSINITCNLKVYMLGHRQVIFRLYYVGAIIYFTENDKFCNNSLDRELKQKNMNYITPVDFRKKNEKLEHSKELFCRKSGNCRE